MRARDAHYALCHAVMMMPSAPTRRKQMSKQVAFLQGENKHIAIAFQS